MAASFASAPLTAIAEKNPIGKGILAQQFGQLNLRLDVIEVGDMDELPRLILNSLNHFCMAMAEITDGQTSYEIEIFPSIAAPDLTPLAPD